jgi:outer membrane protein assembly factor BamB
MTGVDGQVYGLSLKAGKPLWSFRAGAPIASSPLAVGDAVYFGCNDHSVYAITTG